MASEKQSAAALLLLLLGLLVCTAAGAATAAVQSQAAELSDQAFALLNLATSDGAQSAALLGPVGGFAADAQKLSQALGAGDRTTAAASLGALDADRKVVERAFRDHPAALEASRWKVVEGQLAQLSDSMAKEEIIGTPPGAAGAAPGASSGAAAALSAAPAAAPASSSLNGSNALAVKIESVTADEDGVLHLKGRISGAGIQSAGVYEGDELLAKLNVVPDPHRQVIALDLQIAHVGPGEVLRVYGANGEQAEAPIVVSGLAPSLAAEPPPEALPGELSGPRLRLRSQLHKLGSVQVRIFRLLASAANPGVYEVAGQVSGSNIAQAAIYGGGQMLAMLPVNSEPGYHIDNFDVMVPMPVSGAAPLDLRVVGRDGGYVVHPLWVGGVPLGAGG